MEARQTVGGSATGSSVAPEVARLEEAVGRLEAEVARLQKNADAVAQYQQDLLRVCSVWNSWLRNAQALQKPASAREDAVPASAAASSSRIKQQDS